MARCVIAALTRVAKLWAQLRVVLGARVGPPGRVKRWSLLAAVVLPLALLPSAAQAQTVGNLRPSEDSALHRSANWFTSGGMSLNTPNSAQSDAQLWRVCPPPDPFSCSNSGYAGYVTPPSWLFSDPAHADDPWHFLPMTRWARVNDFFSTGEGGIASAFNNVLNATYTTLVAMAFTFASFLWSITIWLVRMMIGAPTLAVEFMQDIGSIYNDYASAVLNSGWVMLLMALSVMVGAWVVIKGAGAKEGIKRVLATAMPLAMIMALTTFTIETEDPNGNKQTVGGPEWLFATTLRLSSMASEPIIALTDAFTNDPHNAPDQLVTCDGYTAVLEGNFIRAWNTSNGSHREQAKFKDSSGKFLSTPAFLIHQWSIKSDEIRMRIALTVSRIWESAYATGYGRAQFGDLTVSERAFCLIADWRTREVTPLEQLAIWRETCFLRAFARGTTGTRGGSIRLGHEMALTGCELFPQIEPPRITAQRPEDSLSGEELFAVKVRGLLLAGHGRYSSVPNSGKCAVPLGGRGPSRYPLPEGGYQPMSKEACISRWTDYIQRTADQAYISLIERSVTVNSPSHRQTIHSRTPSHAASGDELGNTDQHLAARTYAGAIFDPSNRPKDGERWALRAFHGAFSSCDFTSFTHDNLNNKARIFEAENRNHHELPIYPTHAAKLRDIASDGFNNSVDVAAYASIRGRPSGVGDVIKVDARMWGLGFDGIGVGGRGQKHEIVTPDACVAYLFGSGNNRFPPTGGAADYDSDPDISGASIWTPGDLGIHDSSNSIYGNAVDGGQFRWDSGKYPPSSALLVDSRNSSPNEYPGARNPYAYNRLGRTPEEYRDSASLWHLTTQLQNTDSSSIVHVPNQAASRDGADVFAAIHGRSRAESGILAVLAVVVSVAYLLSLAGLSLGAALSVVILGLLIATLPVSLLMAALPFESARSLPKKLLKLGVGASLSYAMFMLAISLMLMIIDILMRVVAAVEVRSGEFWYTVLLALAPLLALKGVGSIFKSFGANITGFKGALAFTSGMTLANMEAPKGGKAKQYMRRGMRGMAYGGMLGGAAGASGASLRTSPQTGSGPGAGEHAMPGSAMSEPPVGGAALAAASTGRSLKSVARNVRASVSSGTGRTSGGPVPVGGSAPAGGVKGRVARRLAFGAPAGGGRVRRALSFARRHPALAGAAMLFPLGGIGAAGAFYAAGKVARLTGAGAIARVMLGMPMRRGRGRQRGPRRGDGNGWVSTQVQRQRQRAAERLDPSLRKETAPPPADPSAPGADVGQAGAPTETLPTFEGAAHAGAVHGVGHGETSPALCLADTKHGTPCRFLAGECPHHNPVSQMDARRFPEEAARRSQYASAHRGNPGTASMDADPYEPTDAYRAWQQTRQTGAPAPSDPAPQPRSTGSQQQPRAAMPNLGAGQTRRGIIDPDMTP